MRVRLAWIAAAGVGIGALCALHGTAAAGPALDADGKPQAAQPGETTIAGEAVVDPNANQPEEPEYGVGIRIREVFVPKALLQLFTTRAPGSEESILTSKRSLMSTPSPKDSESPRIKILRAEVPWAMGALPCPWRPSMGRLGPTG